MTSSGFELDASVISTLTDTASGIMQTIINVAPQILIAGVGVFGVLLVVNRIPSWFKRFL